jgi:hypothetical protein
VDNLYAIWVHWVHINTAMNWTHILYAGNTQSCKCYQGRNSNFSCKQTYYDKQNNYLDHLCYIIHQTNYNKQTIKRKHETVMRTSFFYKKGKKRKKKKIVLIIELHSTLYYPCSYLSLSFNKQERRQKQETSPIRWFHFPIDNSKSVVLLIVSSTLSLK